MRRRLPPCPRRPRPPGPCSSTWTATTTSSAGSTHDIDQELAAVGSNADVQVVVLADRAPGYSVADGDWTGTLAFNVRKGMKATPENAVADWGERDMGSPQTLVDFVTWARASYPSRRTALVFWDHGWGWWPGDTMQDVTSNDYLDMEELRGALEAVGGVDMAGMETCLGQTIEVQAQFRGVAKALAGSEDSTGYTTFFYPEILARPAGAAGDERLGAGGRGREEHPHRPRQVVAHGFGRRPGLALGPARAGGERSGLGPRRRDRRVSRRAGGGAPRHGLAAAELPRGARPVRHGRRDQGARRSRGRSAGSATA